MRVSKARQGESVQSGAAPSGVHAAVSFGLGNRGRGSGCSKGDETVSSSCLIHSKVVEGSGLGLLLGRMGLQADAFSVHFISWTILPN